MAAVSDARAGVGRLRAWVAAARPRTLPAAAAPIAVGTATAAAGHAARPGVAALTLLTALLLQVGANFANDLFDFEKGADTPERRGPPRAVQAGWLSAREMRRGMLLALAAAAAAGLGLVVVGGWPVLVLGALALAAAVAYTGGPWPLGYHGLGDACVFLFFGGVGVVGTHWLQAGAISALAVAAALPVGGLVTAILVVNNLRDRESDRRAGKRTLAVRMGARATRIYYATLLALAYAIPPALFAAGLAGPVALLPLASAPLALRLARTVAGSDEAPRLDAALAGTARLGLLFAALFALGIVA